MASTLVNTLYPPLVDTFMPAFIRTEAAKVTFSISPYNTSDEIKYIHVNLTDLDTNQSVINPLYNQSQQNMSVLNRTVYGNLLSSPIVLNGILIIPFSQAQKDKDTDLYSIKLPPSILKHAMDFDNNGTKETSFPNNKYFKVQLRFDGSDIVPTDSDYLIKQRPYFSEWSSVCLIKPIAKPEFVLTGFDRAKNDKNFIRSFTQGTILVSGYLSFPDDETERLTSYEVFLYDDKEQIVDRTGVLYPSGIKKNEIDCMLNADNTVPGEIYKLVVKGITTNHYEPSIEYKISIADYEGDYTFRAELSLKEDVEEGCVLIRIVTEDNGTLIVNPAPGRLYVKRASSIDDFKTWEVLTAIDQESSMDIDELVVDNTVGSLISYQYAIQFQFYKGTWSKTTYSDVIYPTFYDILLNRGDKQLAIRYNGQLSSYKPVVSRSKFDTLGSKHPKFAENAQLNYKQYSLSGLISAEGDFNRSFISEYSDKYREDMRNYEAAFGKNYMLRNDSLPNNIDDSAKAEHDTYPHENWYWERQFREEVVQWLNDGEPKLFRSMPEGNMIVMITDVNLTPNQNIGRMLYSFTATVYEVGDGYSLKELDKAGIIDAPDIYAQNFDISEDITKRTISSLRQIEFVNGKYENKYTDAIEAFVNTINEEYEGIRRNRRVSEGSLTISKIKLEFKSKPTWLTDAGVSVYDLSQRATIAHFGYAVQIQSWSDPLFIPSTGIYVLPSDVTLNTLQIMNNDSVLVTCIVSYEEEIITAFMPDVTYREETVVGQHSGLMYCGEWLGDLIKSKYKLTTYRGKALESTQKMRNWKNISFDVTPYSIVDILFENELLPTTITIGRTGVYALEPLCYVDNIRFVGRRMFRSTSPYSQLDPWEFNDSKESKEGFRNAVYEKEGSLVIYHNGQEYPFTYDEGTTSSGIAQIPIEGYVNYLGDIVRSEYIEL